MLISQLGSGIASFKQAAIRWCNDRFSTSPVTGEVAEWSVDKSKLQKLVADSTPFLPGGVVGLVVQYLKKTHQIGPEDLQALFGRAEIVRLFVVNKIALPPSIDQELQLPYRFHNR
jgi:hypothetical protein